MAMAENREYWLRARSIIERQRHWPDDAIVVFVAFRAEFAYRDGLPSQDELNGPGLVDIKVEPDFGSKEEWSDQEALDYCVDVLKKHKEKGGELPSQYLEAIFLDHQLLETPGITVGPVVIAPNKQVAHEVIIPKEVYAPLLEAFAVDLIAFRTLEQIGYQSVRTRVLDRQPLAFREWFEMLITGAAKPPGRQPKGWSILTRDRLILVLVQTLTKHHISPTRNSATADKGQERSGCDFVAKACLIVGIRNVSSYETVKEIYYKSKH